MTANEITHKQARCLAVLLHELRDDWDVPGIEYVIGAARHMAPAADLAVAAIRAASNLSNRTPAVIALDGPHWRPTATSLRPRLTRDERRARTCETCGALDGCRPPEHPFVPLTRATEGRVTAPGDLRAEIEPLRTFGAGA